jgi:hypothetical protein
MIGVQLGVFFSTTSVQVKEISSLSYLFPQLSFFSVASSSKMRMTMYRNNEIAHQCPPQINQLANANNIRKGNHRYLRSSRFSSHSHTNN